MAGTDFLRLQVISRLRLARGLFDTADEEFDLLIPGPVQPSIYERDLVHLSSTSPSSSLASPPRVGRGGVPDLPLPQPCPHVLDGGGLSVVVGASRFLNGNGIGGAVVESGAEARGEPVVGGSTMKQGRASMFARFW